MNQIKIQRFCGFSVHPVVDVEVYVDHGSPTLLNLSIKCGDASEEEAPEDEACGWTKPSVTFWVPVPSMEAAELDDLRVEIPWTYLSERDAKNLLYVFEHEDLWNIHVSFEIHSGLVHVTFEGQARDPNHYTGDRPDARVSGRAQFRLP